MSLHRRYVRPLDPSEEVEEEEEEDEEELYKAQTNGVSDGMTLFFYFKQMYTFILQGCVKFIKSDGKVIYNVTKYFYFK